MDEVLSYITYIGIVLSCVGLVITIITMIIFKYVIVRLYCVALPEAAWYPQAKTVIPCRWSTFVGSHCDVVTECAEKVVKLQMGFFLCFAGN